MIVKLLWFLPVGLSSDYLSFTWLPYRWDMIEGLRASISFCVFKWGRRRLTYPVVFMLDSFKPNSCSTIFIFCTIIFNISALCYSGMYRSSNVWLILSSAWRCIPCVFFTSSYRSRSTSWFFWMLFMSTMKFCKSEPSFATCFLISLSYLVINFSILASSWIWELDMFSSISISYLLSSNLTL